MSSKRRDRRIAAKNRRAERQRQENRESQERAEAQLQEEQLAKKDAELRERLRQLQDEAPKKVEPSQEPPPRPRPMPLRRHGMFNALTLALLTLGPLPPGRS